MLGLSHKFVIETELFCEVKRTRLSSIEAQPKKVGIVVVVVVFVVVVFIVVIIVGSQKPTFKVWSKLVQ